MIRIRGRFATYGEVWFDEEPSKPLQVDVVMYRHRPAPVEDRRCAPVPSLVNDLLLSENELMAELGNTNRYKIKRAESKDRVQAEIIVEPRSRLQEFCDFYDAFAKQKSLQGAYRRGLWAACEARQLVLTRASQAELNLVWHAYVTHGKTAALLHSASHFRGKDNDARAVVGRANRWLHWRDMLAFKDRGLACYDWGGLFEDTSVPQQASINNFKCEFGGRRVQLFNCTLPVTLKGRAFLAARDTLERMRGR